MSQTTLALTQAKKDSNPLNLQTLLQVGNGLASSTPDSKFANAMQDTMKGMGTINSLTDAVSQAKQGNYFSTAMALAGLDPNSEAAQTMGKVNSAKQAFTALQSGSLMGAGMALANIAPGSDFGEAMSKVAQAKSMYDSLKGIINPTMKDLVLNIQPPDVASVKSNTKGGSTSFSGSNGAIIENGQMSLECDSCNQAHTVGNPVSTVYGSKVLSGAEDVDHIGRGYLSFSLARTYNSQNTDVGWFGQGWASTGYEQRLEIDEPADRIYLIDNSGRQVPFTYVNVGEHSYQPFENLTLHRPNKYSLTLYMGDYNPQSEGLNNYENVAQHFSHVHSHRKKGSKLLATLLPSKQTDQYGHELQLHYTNASTDIAHLPSHITDDAGDCYQLEFVYIDNTKDKEKNSADTPIIPRLSKLSLFNDPDNATNPFIEIVSYQYNEVGNLIKVIKEGRAVREFAYTYHLMTWHKMPNGRQSHYRYEDINNQAKVVEHWIDSGETYHFDYHTDEKGVHHTIVTEQKETELERTRAYQYNDHHFMTAFTDPNGNTTTYQYSQFNKLKQITHPDGGHTKYSHQDNKLNNVQTLIGHEPLTNLPRYRQTDYQFDQQGNLNKITNAKGHSTQLIYDQHKQVSQSINANGDSTHFEYDQNGNLLKNTLANGSSFQFEYNGLGQMTKQTDCSGYSSHYEYDNAGRTVAITDPQGKRTELYYQADNSASPSHVKSPNGTVEKFDYDDAGRLNKHTDPSGQDTQYEYTIDDLPTKRIDSTGNNLAYEYDKLRRLSKLINENGEEWTFTYDKADNLISETRFDGYTSEYRYNQNNQLIEQIDNPLLDTNKQRHVYLQRDIQGQLLAKHSLDYAEKKSVSKGQKKVELVKRKHRHEFDYDILGNLIKASSPDASSELAYDNLGLLIKETLYRHHAKESLTEQTLSHEYDALGNRVKTILPDGKQLNQLYYGSGHLYNQSITDVDGKVTELRHSERNALHQEVRRLQGQQGSEIQTLFEYDAMGRLVGTNTHHEKNPNPNKQHSQNLIERNYVYDTIGQLTDISGSTQLVGGVANNANNTNSQDRYQRRHHYQYDSVGRLTRHKLTDFANSSGTTEHFAFDPASNRVPVRYEESTTDEQDSLYQDTAFTADVSAKSKTWKRVNTLTTHNKEIGYYYDCHGRIGLKTQTPLGKDGKVLKQSGDSIVGYLDTLKLFYNPNNELERSERVRQEGFEVVKTTTRYQYDAFGRRVAKVSETQHKSKLSPHSNRLLAFEKAYQSEKTQKQCMFMLWDGNRQIQEYAESHVFTTVYEQDSFVPVVRLVASYADNAEMKVYHYHTDHLGTPNELTDDKGKVVWLADYYAWGERVNSEALLRTSARRELCSSEVSDISCSHHYKTQCIGDTAITADELQPIRFQGQFFDGETGLHYNRFRYYDGDVGMFISRDPIGLMGGMNNFQYAPNPVGWIDPFGLEKNLFYGSTGCMNGCDLNNNAKEDVTNKNITNKKQPILKNTTAMTNLNLSLAAFLGLEVGAGVGKSYNEAGEGGRCFSITVCGSAGSAGSSASLTQSHNNSSSSGGGMSYTIGNSAVGSFGGGAVVGANQDFITGAKTMYVGAVAGGKVGVSADACMGPSYCFQSPEERARKMRAWEKTMEKIPQSPPIEVGVMPHSAEYYESDYYKLLTRESKIATYAELQEKHEERQRIIQVILGKPQEE